MTVETEASAHTRNESIAELIGRLAQAGITVAVAESLTGGLLVAELIGPAGASAVVTGGVVAYQTALKRSLLGVDPGLLADHGPVHPLVAEAMAVGVRHRLSVDGRMPAVGLSTTGVAGPDPQDGVRPGTVFVGVSTARGTRSVALELSGSRDAIRRSTVLAAIDELRRETSRIAAE